jgi:hypothetical protein
MHLFSTASDKHFLTAAAPYSCDNIIANHQAVISVGATDKNDQSVPIGPRSCVDLWAPGGGLGASLVGAHPDSPSTYTHVINRSFAAAALMAGIAAQYLQLHPGATASDVRKALLDSASGQVVTLAGPPAALAFTNLTQASANAPHETQPTVADGNSLGTATIVAIACGTVAGELVVLAGLCLG